MDIGESWSAVFFRKGCVAIFSLPHAFLGKRCSDNAVKERYHHFGTNSFYLRVLKYKQKHVSPSKTKLNPLASYQAEDLAITFNNLGEAFRCLQKYV